MQQELPPPRHVPAHNNQGWGVAALIVGLAIAFNAWSTWVHFSEYRDPQDPLWSYKTQPAGHGGDAAPAEHGTAPAAAEH